jgi:ubiquinone/menaquinone biosynthesis C-methylase UbiE
VTDKLLQWLTKIIFMNDNFDQYASEYDAWFLENKNVLYSELKLVAHYLHDAGKILSVGCGSGLFETLLQQEYNITVKHGLEPSKSMAEIAIKRGMTVEIASAEEGNLSRDQYDTLLFNGTASYINDLQLVFNKAYQALQRDGRVVVIDVPKESSYALLYSLAKVHGTWNHPMLEGAFPPNPYPVEFIEPAIWRSTPEKVDMLKNSGFAKFSFAQTLTRHPVYSDNDIEEPSEGYDRGDYVAICAFK